jgi:uncharacterized protein YbaP (TraB family)
MHFLPSGAFRIPTKVREVHRSAEKVYFESDLDMRIDTDVYARLPQGTALETLLSSDVRAKAQDQWSHHGLSEPLENYLPWYIALRITLGIYAEIGFLHQNGFDDQLFRLTERRSAKVLEAPADGIRAMASGPADEQEEGLRRALTPGLVADNMHRMSECLKTSDFRGWEQEYQITQTAMPQTCKAVFDDRNLRWLPKIASLGMTRKRTLVIVGALHLFGPAGLIKLLEERGRVVEAVAM